MTPQEKATEGIRLLKEAVVDYLSMRPDRSELTATIRDDLGLRCENAEGERRDQLIWGIGNLLQSDGSVRKQQIEGRNYLALESSAVSN